MDFTQATVDLLIQKHSEPEWAGINFDPWFTRTRVAAIVRDALGLAEAQGVAAEDLYEAASQ